MREDGVVPGVERLLARIKELEAENAKLRELIAGGNILLQHSDSLWSWQVSTEVMGYYLTPDAAIDAALAQLRKEETKP